MAELTDIAQNKSMRIICRVLLVFADHGPMTVKEAMSHLPDLNESQVSAAAVQLAVKQKLHKKYANGKQTVPLVYEYNEEFKPPARTNYGKSQSPVSRAANSKGRVRQQTFYRFRDKKIALIERLIAKCGGMDKDLLIGILNDYRQL